MAPDEPILAYKAFNADFSCHPSGGQRVQYAVGETATFNGDVEACKGGLHACERPLDVLNYYPPNTSRFAVVRLTGKVSRRAEDSKIAAASLTVEAEIGIPTLVQKTVEWVLARCTPEGETATGYSGAASATGESGAASATGTRGAASATGESGAASATGESGAASATGTRGAASATGYSGAASATGYSGAASATGRFGRAMGAEGCAIFLVYRTPDWKILHARAAIVGEGNVKPNVWYSLDAEGKFVEVTQ